MKKLLLIAALFVSGLVASAQTVIVTNPVPGGSTDQSGTVAGFFGGGSTNGTFASLYKGFGDTLAFAEGNTNGWARLTLEAGYLSTTHQGNGEFLNLYIPLSGTNNIFGAGFGFAYLNKSLYDGTVNARLGDTIPLPYGLQKLIPIYAYIESGAGYNFKSKVGIAQAFAGASLHYSLFKTAAGNTFDVTAGYALGTISDITGNVKAFGGGFTWTW